MLSSLLSAFGDAYKLVQPSVKAGELLAPYTLRNDTGTNVAVKIDKALEVTQLKHRYAPCPNA